MSNNKIGFDFGPENHQFADQVARAIIETTAQTGEYRGIGGHDVQNHGPHGPHSQVSIGYGDTTVNIRKCQ